MNNTAHVPGSSLRQRAKSPSHDRSATEFDSRINERIADKIQQEIWFRILRLPSRITHSVRIVPLTLIVLWIFLVLSNTYGPFGYWESFIRMSTGYRQRFTNTQLARQTGLDSPGLDSYSLWRGVVVISIVTTLTYVSISLLALRHELFHWKPELLARYLDQAKVSFPGRYLPSVWLDRAFNLYEHKHAENTFNKIQNRGHRAVEDHRAFLKIVICVAGNILVSYFVVFAMWMTLLHTKFESHNIVKLPRSMVPPVQAVIWYLINDTFYFFPHFIAHTPRGRKGMLHKVLPNKIAEQLQEFFRNIHKTHHKSKANLAIAAWYCSPTEQILFNLFPAMIGPIGTQVLADAMGYSDTWGTHIIALYIWCIAGTASSVLAHTGYRSRWNDPGLHDEHHEYAFGQDAVNFGTAGVWDLIFGTRSMKSANGAVAWHAQRDRQAALVAASKRSGIPLTKQQTLIIQQPLSDPDWADSRIED
ncbi:hypothetical protein D9615_003154 [Tricholomella constricta]|uniref:Fatty acid hydroxylase domain-containing protein n=1 Tax=Tricholomella constricta TaxID=117010 RepID=A0A8H5HJ90_9AGAR|nr:hypothetical protein D9615_003154 [Tricholomella constricta]